MNPVTVNESLMLVCLDLSGQLFILYFIKLFTTNSVCSSTCFERLLWINMCFIFQNSIQTIRYILFRRSQSLGNRLKEDVTDTTRVYWN